LLSWKAKILELEQLEDKAIDDSTKRLWLTSTLSTKTHMLQCLNQAKVTEMSIMAMQPGTTNIFSWDGFYNIILAHAKLHDHSTKSTTNTNRQTNVAEQGRTSGRNGGRGRGGGFGRGGTAGRGTTTTTTTPTDLVFTTVTGPTMVMKANMKFHPDEWKKLSPSQKAKLRTAKGLPSLTPPIPRETNNTTVQPVVVTPIEIAPVIPVVSSDSLLRQTLSNRAVRTSPPNNNDVIDQFTHNGSTYQRITNHLKISYHIQSASRQNALGALIDGGANGGMSGCDVRVIEQTLQSADVTGLAQHSVKDLPIATVAAVLNTSRGNIIGI
jgi:hypothetical protein